MRGDWGRPSRLKRGAKATRGISSEGGGSLEKFLFSHQKGAREEKCILGEGKIRAGMLRNQGIEESINLMEGPRKRSTRTRQSWEKPNLTKTLLSPFKEKWGNGRVTAIYALGEKASEGNEVETGGESVLSFPLFFSAGLKKLTCRCQKHAVHTVKSKRLHLPP